MAVCPAARTRTRTLALCLFCLSWGGLACDWDWNRSSDPPRAESDRGAGSLSTPPLLATGPAAAESARPSVDENMGRSFQGVVDLRLSAPRGAARRLRYLSQGNEARLQIDGATGQSGFDAVIWGEKIAVLDHERRTYRTYELDTLRTAGEDGEVRIEPTGERRLLSGVPCERHEIDDGPVHISACVTALAGTFAPDKLEAISDVNVPAWVEELLRRQLFPLQASATAAGGRPLYSLELVRYAAGPIDEAMVAVPRNYREVTGSAAPGASRRAADSEGAP